MYFYESHLGGIYTCETELDYDSLYCEECGDSDTFLGSAETREEAWDLIKDLVDIHGSGGYPFDYAEDMLNEYFPGEMCEGEKHSQVYSEKERTEKVVTEALEMYEELKTEVKEFKDPNGDSIKKLTMFSPYMPDINISFTIDRKIITVLMFEAAAVFRMNDKNDLKKFFNMSADELYARIAACSDSLKKEFCGEKARQEISDHWDHLALSDKKSDYIKKLKKEAMGCISAQEWKNVINRDTDAYFQSLDNNKRPDSFCPQAISKNTDEWICNCGDRYSDSFLELVAVIGLAGKMIIA